MANGASAHGNQGFVTNYHDHDDNSTVVSDLEKLKTNILFLI